MNNNMYPRQYIPNYNNYNQQSIYDQIDNEINSLQQMKERMKNNPVPSPTNLTQNFQISPINRETMKYVSSIDEVQKETVFSDTPFFSKDMSVVWIKNTKGEIKSYELKEIMFKDERDLLIESLQMQVEELRKEVKNNAKSIDTNDDEPTSNEKPTNIQPSRTIKKK